jgi:hypothetical protein
MVPLGTVQALSWFKFPSLKISNVQAVDTVDEVLAGDMVRMLPYSGQSGRRSEWHRL